MPQRAQRKSIDFGFRISDCGLDRRLVLCVLCVLCGYFLLGAARTRAAPQEVVPVDRARFRGELASIDAGGRVTFRVVDDKDKDGAVRTLSLAELVRWGNPAAPRAQTIVVLADGARIVTVADWAGGAALKLAGGDLVVVSDTWGEVRLARGLISGIVFAQQRRLEDRERLVERITSEPPKANAADAVILTNGDRLTGKLTELDRGSLAIETRAGVVRAPLSRVEAIAFGGPNVGTQTDPALKAREKFAVGLRDGSLVYVSAIRVGEKEMDVELRNGVKLKGDAAGEIVAIQSLDGPVVYLSDLEGADYRGVPYLSLTWPFTRDRNVLGETIVVRGKRYLKGIGMHSAARLTYRFVGDYRRFDSAVAIDDSAKSRGSVTFGVYVLRDDKWGEAFKSGIVRGADEPQAVSIDLKGAKGITLTVDFADRGDELDHAVWLDARLIR
jgi:hypothetical protein